MDDAKLENSAAKAPRAPKKKRAKPPLPPGDSSSNLPPRPRPRSRPKTAKKPLANGDRSPSESQENNGNADDSVDNESPPPKKPKRKANAAGAPAGAKKKIAKRRKSRQTVDILGGSLKGLEDEVQPIAKMDDAVIPSGQPAPQKSSTNAVYMQYGNRFLSANREKMEKTRIEMMKKYEEDVQKQEQNARFTSRMRTVKVAMNAQKLFRIFSLFCHGLLAGFALWHCVMSFVITRTDRIPIDFKNSTILTGFGPLLAYYVPVALPTQSMYYFLLAICLMSTLDRFEFADFNREFLRSMFFFQNGSISILIYLATLVVSLATVSLDDKIGSSETQEGLWIDVTTLYQWRTLNLVRAVGALIGWCILSTDPVIDKLSKHIEEAGFKEDFHAQDAS